MVIWQRRGARQMATIPKLWWRARRRAASSFSRESTDDLYTFVTYYLHKELTWTDIFSFHILLAFISFKFKFYYFNIGLVI